MDMNYNGMKFKGAKPEDLAKFCKKIGVTAPGKCYYC